MLGLGVRVLRKLVRPGIRGRLLLLTLPVVNVVFAAIWLVVTTTARDGVLELSRSNLQSAATALAEALDQGIIDAYTDAMTAARLDITAQAIDSRDPKNFAWFADELVRSKRRYAAIVVTDASGVIVASNRLGRDGRAGPRLTGERLPDQEWVRSLLAGKTSGNPVRIPLGRPAFLQGVLLGDEQVLGVGRPVTDLMGERIGALAVFLSSHYLGEILDSQLASSSEGVDALALIADSSNKVAVLPSGLRAHPSWAGRDLHLQAGAQDDDLWTGPSGRPFLHRSRAIASANKVWDLQVVVLRTLARVEAPVRQLSRRLFVAFFLGSLLTTAILVLVATRFVGPIRRLTAAASRTERAADFEAIQVETMDEVGQLTTAFNRMLADLRDYQVGLELKVDQRTRELAQSQKEVTDILDNMQQAVFTVGADGLIRKEVSAHAREIFGNVELAGRPLADLLQLDRLADQEQRSRMQFWLANIFGADDLQWMLTESDRLAETTYRRPMSDGTVEDRLLKIEYAPIYKLGIVDRVMVIAKDVTELQRLQAEVARKEEENRLNLDRALQITALDPDLFDTFSNESDFLLSMAESLLGGAGEADRELPPEVINELFRVMHTFKGNARVFKLTTLQEVAHAAEDTLDRARGGAISVGGLRPGPPHARRVQGPGGQAAAAPPGRPGQRRRSQPEDPGEQDHAAAPGMEGDRGRGGRGQHPPAPGGARPDGEPRPGHRGADPGAPRRRGGAAADDGPGPGPRAGQEHRRRGGRGRRADDRRPPAGGHQGDPPARASQRHRPRPGAARAAGDRRKARGRTHRPAL
jgi:HPt (histidine-containing phosphotransfer) domain-containing protein/PAS domain-containing protein